MADDAALSGGAAGSEGVAGSGFGPPNEDVLVLPAGLRRVLHPRRGGTAVSAPVISPDSLREVREAAESGRHRFAPALDQLASDQELVVEARAALAELTVDPPLATVSPLAAATLAVLFRRRNYGEEKVLVDLVDVLVAARGPAFAAVAVAELFRLNLASAPIRLLRRATEHTRHFWVWESIGGRARAHLVAASDAEYASAVAALGALRSDPVLRPVTSFLAPTRQEWVTADCTEFAGQPFALLMLLAAVGEPAQAERVRVGAPFGAAENPMIGTLLDGLGADALDTLLAWYDAGFGAEVERRLIQVIALLPSDTAMRAMIERLDRKYVQGALLGAVKRFPVRAVRVFGSVQGSRPVDDLLRTAVLGNPDAAAVALTLVDEATAERIRRAGDTAAMLAESASVPDFLRVAPWEVKRGPAAKKVTLDLRPPAGVRTEWLPGERDAWIASGFGSVTQRTERYGRHTVPQRAELVAAGKHLHQEDLYFFATAPEEIARPVLAGWSPRNPSWTYETWARALIGRFDTDAHRVALEVATATPHAGLAYLAPFVSAEAALLMARQLAGKRHRRTVLAWLDRHPAGAAAALIPPALGRGADRRYAEQALRSLAERGHADAVRTAAAGYDGASEPIEALLGADPLMTFPAKIPTLPPWVEPGTLPQVRWRDGSGAVPRQAMRHVCVMLAFSTVDDPYVGLTRFRELVDPASLAEFGWALFERWQAAGTPSKEGWVLTSLGLTGDDDTARKLSPVIRAWPGEGGHSRAVTGLEVLARIGTDVALMHLHGMSEKVRFKGLKDRAGEMMVQVADTLGLTRDQLGDRLVPDLGLDASGAMTLDYGPRRFTVGFDEQLKPYVADEGGRRKSLPKPGAKDDPALAPAAYQRFSGLKKDVRTLASDQIRRLEEAMTVRRQWTVEEFRQYLVGHPLLWHICRRLVWTARTATSDVSFRVAEDRTLADVSDEVFVPDPGASIGIAHPVLLGDGLGAWSELFADYQILQPFPQLGRPVYALTGAERAAPSLDRFTGIKMDTGRVVGLERRGWRRGDAQDAGIQGWMYRPLPDGRTLVATLEPGIAVGWIDGLGEQSFTEIWVSDRPDGGWRRPGDNLTLDALDPVLASELIRDLTEVTRV